MSSAKLTLIGMNTYFQNAGSDLFEFLSLPTGLTKKTLTDNILLEGGEFEVLYSDPMSLKTNIGIWSDREQATFKRWVDALAIEYAPLENYDRHEDWTDTLDSDSTLRSVGTDDTSTTRSDDTTRTTSEDISRTISDDTSTTRSEDTITDGTVQTDVSAYDSSSYQPKDKVTSHTAVDDDASETINKDVSETVDDDVSETINNDISETIDNDTTLNNTTTLDNTGRHTGRVHGNIGVTTSQQMLESELDLGYWNIYSRITDMFLKEFCIMIYV